ncbi:ADAMTS-like protein 4 [Prorops nasuta]|uniref:ADAMTS-like protein 4 n=1 Tax=Prorops nasuta TaxID=863751 RepID=UPI0034CF219B
MFQSIQRTVLLALLITVWVCHSHLIDGIFTEPTLKPGYNLVASVPAGASALNVTELRHTQNYLAIRLQNGTYLLNGNYNINWSGEYKAVGTTFLYFRQNSQNLESFSAIGPLLEPIDVMVLYQEPNPGIVYRYYITSKNIEPSKTSNSTFINEATSLPHLLRRSKKRKFAWKSNGYTECSKSCGGGIQRMKYICVREHTQAHVPDKRCHSMEAPREGRLWCNTKPCPPIWRTGDWSECSVTCDSGIRTREVECVQEIRSTLTMRVSEGACLEEKPVATEVCSSTLCNDVIISEQQLSRQWSVGNWSQCSTTCGTGIKSRVVTCSSLENSCDTMIKPPSKESCDLGSCTDEAVLANYTSITSNLQKAQWLYTEWSDKCSAECGVGMQARQVFCEQSPDKEFCDNASRPETTRSCSSNRTCSGQWFLGPWSECSPACGTGEQIREVVCVTTLHGSLRVVLDMNCPANKPDTRRNCTGPTCTSHWFMSDWTECSRTCGKGVQKREVKCLNSEGRLPENHEVHCQANDRPESRRYCNEFPCKHDNQGPAMIQNDPEIFNGPEGNSHCKDTISNCHLVIQARLCTYPYYQKSCCASCYTK